MEILQITLFIITFLFFALMMFFRKIPALLALPLMALIIPLIGGVSWNDVITYVIGKGSVRLHTAYTVAIFGSMLSILMQKTKVAESMIKKGAELSGDNPWLIGMLLLLLITLLFTTLGGLGAIIMVATIVLPIMSSVGIGPMTVVGIFLIGLSMGGILNAGNWAVYVDVMKLTVPEIRTFALIMFGLTLIMAASYLTIQLWRDGHEIKFGRIIRTFLIFILLIAGLYFVWHILPENVRLVIQNGAALLGTILKWAILAGIAGLILSAILRAAEGGNDPANVHASAYLTPVVPLLLILFFEMDFVAAFIVGLIYGFLTTYRKGSLNVLVSAMLEGGGVVMPAVILMFGIGMLLNAVIGPGVNLPQYADGWPVLTLLQPLMQAIIPQSALGYVLIFTLAAPLALYRGPLNVWGLGYGLAAVFLASGMAPGAVMGLLMAVGQIQGISDPTNTHNVWLANEMQQDVQKVLWNTIPYTWSVALAGLCASAILFM
jgi:hypothetical protein